MKKIFISIITPTLNSEKYIEKTCLSLMAQKYKQYEHIIIDCVSKDNTINIIKKYSEKYNITYISENDEGISDAFNKGIKIAKGEWILFLGAGDELINSDTLSIFSEKLLNKVNSYIVWGNVICKNEDGKIGKRISGDHYLFRLRQYLCYHHQSIFHNIRLFKDYGYFDLNIKIAMDYDLILRIYSHINKCDYSNTDVAYVLTGGNSQLSYQSTLRDIRYIQITKRIWPEPFAYLLYYWAIFKHSAKTVLQLVFRIVNYLL